MAELTCASCGRAFLARTQSPKQTYCSEPECQRERRRRWNRAKLKSDPDYRANQAAAHRAWHDRNPDYWKTYRGRKTANAPSGVAAPAVATSDASFFGADPEAGICWMEVRTPGPDGMPRTWRVEITLTRPSVVCKHGRVQREDSMALAVSGT